MDQSENSKEMLFLNGYISHKDITNTQSNNYYVHINYLSKKRISKSDVEIEGDEIFCIWIKKSKHLMFLYSNGLYNHQLNTKSSNDQQEKFFTQCLLDFYSLHKFFNGLDSPKTTLFGNFCMSNRFDNDYEQDCVI